MAYAEICRGEETKSDKSLPVLRSKNVCNLQYKQSPESFENFGDLSKPIKQSLANSNLKFLKTVFPSTTLFTAFILSKYSFLGHGHLQKDIN